MIVATVRNDTGPFVVAICDGCDIACLPSKSVPDSREDLWHRAARVAREWGWTVQHWKCYCPACVPVFTGETL